MTNITTDNNDAFRAFCDSRILARIRGSPP